MSMAGPVVKATAAMSRHPSGDPQPVAEPEERAHREPVADSLILDTTERDGRIPQVEGPVQKGPRVDDQVSLRVGDDPARLLRECGGQEQHADHQQTRATANPAQ
jgi:hypothetical protein